MTQQVRASGAHDPYAALRFPNFRRFIASVVTLTVATQIQAVVVGWQVYAVTKDPLSLGLVGLAEAVPFIAIALFAGHVADRTDRRRVVALATVAMLLCAAALFAFTVIPAALGHGQVWPVFAVIFASGVARSFLQPARQALGAELVPRELYPNAVAWRSSVWQFAAVVGPALGGLLYGFGGPEVAYGVDVALVVVALAAIVRLGRLILPSAPIPVTLAADVSMAESLGAGIRFVRREPVLLAALTLDLFSVFFGGATALLPIFAADILHVGPEGLGLLRAAPSVGAVVMSLAARECRPLRHRHDRVRSFPPLCAVHRPARDQRGRGHGERGHSLDVIAGGDAPGAARPGVLGQSDFHRVVQRDWRVRVRRSRSPPRDRAVRGFWRAGDAVGGWSDRVEGAGASTAWTARRTA
jgi:MFS family permease